MFANDVCAALTNRTCLFHDEVNLARLYNNKLMNDYNRGCHVSARYSKTIKFEITYYKFKSRAEMIDYLLSI